MAQSEPAKRQQPSQEAIEILARVLSGPKIAKYRAESSSRPGAFYELEVDGNDVSCTCRGFQYRGNCQHSRALKAALVKGEDLPKGFREGRFLKLQTDVTHVSHFCHAEASAIICLHCSD